MEEQIRQIRRRPFAFDDAPKTLNPHHWSRTRKLFVLSSALYMVVMCSAGSSISSGGIAATLKEYGIPKRSGWEVLPVTSFLSGAIVGSTILAPLSEQYGRKPINIITTLGFLVSLMGCALAPDWVTFNALRMISGLVSAGPASTISGTCADLYADQISRGRALLSFNIFTYVGAVLGPIISGWAVLYSWRLSFWIVFALTGIGLLEVWIWMPETNHQITLDLRAKRIRRFTGDSGPRGPSEVEHISMKRFLSKVLLRPLLMFCQEPVVLFTCLYIAFQYAVFYSFLQSYAIIYEGVYGFSSGEEGLAFLGFGIGVLLAFPAQYTIEKIFFRAYAKNKSWTRHHGAKRLPAAIISGPLIVMSLFWCAWTARPSIHWIAPVASGIPYGLGYTLNINALLNYLVDSYTSTASSASAASSLTRQAMGAALPFAAAPMYSTLGVAWATSLLGFIAAAMSLIPFAFWIWGETLLRRSKFAQNSARGSREMSEDLGAEDAYLLRPLTFSPPPFVNSSDLSIDIDDISLSAASGNSWCLQPLTFSPLPSLDVRFSQFGIDGDEKN